MNQPDAYDRASGLFEAGALQQAFDVCRHAIGVDDRDGRFCLLAARISTKGGQPRRAVGLAVLAARRRPQDAFAHAYLAKCHAAVHQPREARVAAEHAAALRPADAATWDLLGFVFTRTGQLSLSRDAFEAAVKIAPNRAEYWLNLGAVLAVSGDIEGAARAYEACVACDPGFVPAYLSLVNLRRATPERNFVAQLERLLGQRDEGTDESAQIGYALARSLEELGEYERALAAYKLAKRGMKAKAKFALDSEREAFAAAALAAKPSVGGGGGHPTEAPIFVVGMPRTGTTLVERIVSSHPDVASAGELSIFPELVRRAFGSSAERTYSAAVFEVAAKSNLSALGREYESYARARLGGAAPRFVDKLPFNFLYAGLIYRALPNARILCLRRDPMDTIIGNYRQFLGGGVYDYSYDLEDTARYYVLFHELVAQWSKALPSDRFAEVVYEDLVNQPERETRRLIAFCGLSWNDACLSPHENASPIATLSSAQVREPINKKSIGRWRGYGLGLEPARKILIEAGLVS